MTAGSTKSDAIWHIVSAHATSASLDAAKVRICLLGSPRILIDGQSVTRQIKYRKGVALLSVLAVESDVMHPRERIANLFWPDLERTAALTNLRQVISNLTRVLNPESGEGLTGIRSDSSHIGLFTDPGISVDIHSLTSRAAARKATDNAAAPVLQQPPLHRFLEGFDLPDCQEYSAWLESQRRKFDADIIHLHEKAVARAMARQDLEQALLHTRLIERIDPLLEVNQVCMMRLLLESGRPKQALVQFERFAERLREELDVEPEPATMALHQHLLTRAATQETMTTRPKWHFDQVTNTTVLYVTCDEHSDETLAGEADSGESRKQARRILDRHSHSVSESLGLGMFAYFDDAHQGAEHGLAAIEAARAVMLELACSPQIRIGIYSGQVAASDTEAHAMQHAKATELARRLGFIADGGDIIVCADTLGSLALEVEYLGEWRFRGINRNVHAYRLGADPAPGENERATATVGAVRARPAAPRWAGA